MTDEVIDDTMTDDTGVGCTVDGSPSILWLTPDKPKNVSVGRRQIVAHLEAAGHDVTIRGTTPGTVVQSIRERGQYDVVVGTTRAGAIAGKVISTLHRVPLVVDHVDPIQQLYETTARPVAALVQVLESLSFRVAAHVLFVYREERQRVRQHANAWSKTDLGVDYERFADPSASAIESARSKLGSVEGKRAIYVGGLEPIYNVQEMLGAVERLDGWTLVVLGTGSLEAEVTAVASRSERVRYLGTVPHEEVPGFLHLSDVGVSMVDDAHTLKVLEYFAAGLPVVQRTGRAEERFGDLVEYAEPTAASIEIAIERAANGNSQERREYARHFDWVEIAEDYARAVSSIR